MPIVQRAFHCVCGAAAFVAALFVCPSSASAADSDPSSSSSSSSSGADHPPSASSRSSSRPFGEAGDVILQDVIGARTSRAPTTRVIAVGTPGLGGLGGLGVGALGSEFAPAAGPSVSAAWFNFASSRVGAEGMPSSLLTTLRFEPSADVFVARHISVGGSIGLEMSRLRMPGTQTRVEANALSLDPRVGYAIPVTDGIALWPRIRGGITLQQQSFAPPPRTYRVGADLPIVIRVSRHVLIDLGPELTYAIVDAREPIGVVSRSLYVAGRAGMSLVF